MKVEDLQGEPPGRTSIIFSSGCVFLVINLFQSLFELKMEFLNIILWGLWERGEAKLSRSKIICISDSNPHLLKSKSLIAP